jgi:N6-adenosine-specific RNA methylase IME4
MVEPFSCSSVVGIDQWPGQKYSIGLIDFPWYFNDRKENRKSPSGAPGKFGWGASSSYERRGELPCIKYPELCAMVPLICSVFERDALIFLWTAPSNTQESDPVRYAFHEQGFKTATRAYTWIKVNTRFRDMQQILLSSPGETFEQLLDRMQRVTFFGTGSYTAANSEDCWVLRRGSGWLGRRLKVCPQVLYAPVNKKEHSRKPQTVRDRIRLGWGALPSLELFATERDYPGRWDALGYKISGRDIRVDLQALRQLQIGREMLEQALPITNLA